MFPAVICMNRENMQVTRDKPIPGREFLLYRCIHKLIRGNGKKTPAISAGIGLVYYS